MWGIHNDTLTSELVEQEFISLGWDSVGDLRLIKGGRDGLKRMLGDLMPEAKPRAIAGWAGILIKFRDEMQVGDIVVAPYKPDSTINIGRIAGPYEFHEEVPTHPHRRRVVWEKVGLSRTIFTQAALYEIGSAITLFHVTKHQAEFLAALQSTSDDAEEVTKEVDAVVTPRDDDGADEPRASRIDRHTRDFVLETLHEGMGHRDFEEFCADLLRAIGYQARVTQYSTDGGVDVIAHRDALGLEPPQIKVQCKHKTSTVGAPEVQQLVGTQGMGEFSLFMTLGAYSRDALSIERQRPGLRLLSGEDIVEMALENYDRMPNRWRALIPLTPVLVVADLAT